MKLKFKIGKESLTRLKSFKDVIKKAEALAKGSQNQLFVVDEDCQSLKVYYYTTSAAGFARANIEVDITDVSIDKSASNYFSVPVDTFISLIEKTKSEETEISFINDQKLQFVGQSSSKFTHVVTNDFNDEKEVEEIVDSIKNALENKFDNATTVSIGKHNVEVLSLGSLTKFINNNECVAISKNSLSTCDICYIVEHTFEDDITDNDNTVFFNRAFTPLLKENTSFVVSEDGLLLYFNIVDSGIQLLVSQPSPNFQYPSDEDIAEIIPIGEDDDYIELAIKTNDLYNVLQDFEGVFQSTDWKYHQIKMLISPNNDFIECSWDDMRSIVESKLPANKIGTNITEDFEIVFPAVHMPLLKNFFLSENLSLLVSPAQPGERGGTGLVLKSGTTSAIISKMLI